jgi:uncharacterized membrane protein
MELSPDEERHIQNLSVIPAAIVTYIFIGLFVCLTQSNESLSFFFCVTYFGAIFLLAVPLALFLTEMILVSRRIRRPLSSYIKQFLGKMSIFILGAALFGIILSMVNLTSSHMIGESAVLILSCAIWFVLWGTLVIRYRKKLDKLSKGDR